MYNYQQILTDLSQIAYHHEQIRSFGFGDITQITNDINTKTEPEYMRCYVVPGDGILQKNQITYKFAIIVMDKVEQDLSNLKDVMSDTLDVCYDIWTVLYQSYNENSGNFSWYIVPNANPEIIPFTEKYETTLGGFTLNIEVVMPFDYNRCDTPVLANFQFPQDQAFKSLRLVVDKFNEFANLHEQIKSFGFGDITQLTNDVSTQMEPKYIRFYVLFDTVKVERGDTNIAFKIIIADKLQEDLSNQEDVLNDTMEIAKDFFAKLYLSDWEAQWGATCSPFLSWYETFLAGWAISVNFTQKFDENRCVLPVSSFSKGITWAELATLWAKEAQKWAEVKKQN
jgi:hypothetical protein